MQLLAFRLGWIASRQAILATLNQWAMVFRNCELIMVGYRIYFKRSGIMVIVLLCGGDKSTQARDIEDAKSIARQWEKDDEQDI